MMALIKAPKTEDQRYSRKTVRHDNWLNQLGNYRCISYQGWEGDTVTVVPEALQSIEWVGPPFIPLPFFYYYGGYGMRGNEYEVSVDDRLWITLLITIAPGHSFAMDPCQAVWVDGLKSLQSVGMSRTEGSMSGAAIIPLAYTCNSNEEIMTWTNQGQEAEKIFLMIRFHSGIRLDPGSKWILRLPCIVNGSARTAEFRFKYGQWCYYHPFRMFNGAY